MDEIKAGIVEIKADIQKTNSEIESIQLLLGKPLELWTQEERNKFGNHNRISGRKNANT